MRLRAPNSRLLLLVPLVAGCAAAQVAIGPDAFRVTTGTRPPVGAYEQLGVVTATHGGGCGLYGARGNLEGAYRLLRNKAAQLGADYVQILRITEPHFEGICNYKGFVIDGFAYRVIPGAVGQSVQTQSARLEGLNGTYTGGIVGTVRGQNFTMGVTFTIVQTGDDIAGAWTTTGGTSGAVAGKVVEGHVTGFKAKQLNPCEGEFAGAMVVEDGGGRLRGAYEGSDCTGSVQASFVVRRQ